MAGRRELALLAIEGYNKWDLEAIMANRDDSCIQEILPKSLGSPPMNNTAYRAFFGATLPFFKNFHVVVDEVFEDVAGNKVAMWCRSTADSVAGPYKNEYVMMFHFTEDGSKIVRVREFVDSALSVYNFKKLNAKVEGSGGRTPFGAKRKPSKENL